MSQSKIAERLLRLDQSRQVQEKLAAINDPDVAAYLDRLEAAYADEILRLAIKPGDEAREVAMRREALRYIRGLITGAPGKLVEIAKTTSKLINKDNQYHGE